MKNIVLIGMMGCGKSTCGRRLSHQLHRQLVDTDRLIVQREGRSIPEIFASDGEDYFRRLETELAKELGCGSDLVIACGGGLPLRKENMDALRKNGTVIFLCRRPEEIYDSVSMKGRPLGQGGRESFIARFASREPIYRAVSDVVVTDFSSPDHTVKEIIQRLNQL